MGQTLNCPNCGAPLDYHGEDESIRCPFCGSSVVLQEDFRAEADVTVEAPTTTEPQHSEAWVVGILSSLAASLPILGIIIGIGVAIGVPLLIAISNAIPAPTPTPVPAPTRAPTPTPLPTPTPAFASVMLRFGGSGTGPGLFADARSIALDGVGNIYVADFKGGRVQVFDPTGQFTTQWFVGDSTTLISSLAANRQGNVYVVADGTILRYEGVSGRLLEQLQYAEGDRFHAITTTPDGGLIATWYEEREGLITSIEGHRDDLVRFNPEGEVAWVIRGIISSQTDDPELDNLPAVDGLGNILVLGGEFQPAVFKFTPEGRFIDKFGSHGQEVGQFSFPGAIALDSQSRVYIADTKGIQVFDENGRYLDVFNVDSGVFAMLFNDREELFVLTGTEVVKLVVNQR